MVSWNTLVVNSLLVAAVCLATVTASIFPDEDFGYRHYAKREISSDCLRCARTYNYMSCLRCWNTRYAVIPFHSKRSSDTSANEFTGSEPMSRDRRFIGCNCCLVSRFTNSYCCDVCRSSNKRTGKRSDAASLMSEPEKRMNPACLCCSRSGSPECCEDCMSSFIQY